MYQSREDQYHDQTLAVAGGPALPVAELAREQIVPPARAPRRSFAAWRRKLTARLEALDIAPDLGADIGSRRWFRGFGTMIGLAAVAISFWPDFAPLEAAPPVRLDAAERDEYRSQIILPLGLGADSGRHMGATGLVRPLADAPERPQIEMLATLARGDSFDRMLLRAGVGDADAARVAALIGQAVPLGEIAPGTQVDITLGRRVAPDQPRPLEALAFRARFDLALEIGRGTGALALTRKPIRVDATPLRIRGTVGDSLYRSARAAGAPASAVQAYLRTLAEQMDIDSGIRRGDTFDIILAHRRAATGESQAGPLLFAGVERDGKPRAQLLRWGKDGRFFEASGVGEQRSGLMAPVNAPIGSRFGLRRHPILGYVRMHAGLDYRAAYGTPIVAVTDGVVLSAGRAGGCGNAVKLRHGGGIETRYCHMSRMAVSAGQGVRRGQVIGYVGSTGLSTGAHLHYEMYRGGRAVDPASVQYVLRAQLAGAELASFKAALAQVKAVGVGAALGELAPAVAEESSGGPQREIDRIDASPMRR